MTIKHDVAGDGRPVVLLHSTVCDRRMWDPQLPVLLGAGMRVMRCDFRGYGETPMPERPYNNAQDVADLMDSLGMEQAAFVASSGGGQVALEFAARWPERVSKLALLCTAMRGHEPSAELREFGALEDELLEGGDVDGATELNVRTWVGPHADEAVREKVREMQRHAFEVQLAGPEVESIKAEFGVEAIAAVSLLVSGAHDVVDFREIAVELAKALPQVRHVELDWAGHLPNLEWPERMNGLLLEFL